jgi:hypothetical protein
MKYTKIREESLKSKVSVDWFNQFDTTEILGNIDFTVFPKQDDLFGRTPLLWAEAKIGDDDIVSMFVQLILTIGKARTFDKTFPPPFLGVFDYKKIGFIPYINIQDIFYINDFNWNITPSNRETKEFKIIKERIEGILHQNTDVYDFIQDEKELKYFIKNNLTSISSSSKIKIDKNNFIPIYLRWVEIIKPIIDINWDELKKVNILDSDFYLADLFVEDRDTQNIDDDSSVRDNLFVVFQNQGYRISKENLKQMWDATIGIKFKDTYQQFWKRYKRPPIKEFRDYIIERRDLIVPQDIRERKGAFFTPRIWVELSQKYISDYLGENWQDEYYIWDCAAGTGNLLAGLTNKYNIYASTIDQADINVIHERIQHGANLIKNHVFQFDFLNDDFTKLPQSLQEIINDEEKRKKLIIYINPPYAEATSSKTITGTGENKSGVSTQFKINEYFNPKIGNATNELFTLFMSQVYEKIPNCTLSLFSKLKFIQGTNFIKFKEFFKSKYCSGFVVPADTFDNVKGDFPIGFTIWNTSIKTKIDTISVDVFDKKGDFIGNKNFYGELPNSINKWIKKYENKNQNTIGLMVSCAPDFQHNKQLAILSKQQERYCFKINQHNLIPFSVYFATRHCISPNWLNDRDQFLEPNDKWKEDNEFQSDCLVFTLFNNSIQSQYGINHWIPFTEQDIDAKEKFKSNFMTDFINGKLKDEQTPGTLFKDNSIINTYKNKPLLFSDESIKVFESGRELWKYYHSQKEINVNASFYDIREYFQGRNEKTGRMNSKSMDNRYNELIIELRNNLNLLSEKIRPKIYEYGFLVK